MTPDVAHPSLFARLEDGFLTAQPELLANREYMEYVWQELESTIGTRNQDLIDLYLIASIVLTNRFDCIVEVGRAGGTVTSVIQKLKSPQTRFISVCPQPAYLEETLPALRARYNLNGSDRTEIAEAVLEEFPLVERLGDAESILLLFDAAHNADFARYYLRSVLGRLPGRSLLIGVHDIYCPRIQPRTRPNEWDDPKGPYQSGDYACRWSEVLPVLEYVRRHGVRYQQSGLFFQRLLQEHPTDIDGYFHGISQVKLPPYSELWPFDGQAGTWLFFEGAREPTAPFKPPSSTELLIEQTLAGGRRIAHRTSTHARDLAARAIRRAIPASRNTISPAQPEDLQTTWRRSVGAGPPEEAILQSWQERQQRHQAEIAAGLQAYNYLELVREHAAFSPLKHELMPLFSLPLLVQAKRMVEFGSAFTLYPEGYSTPWQASGRKDEGMVSTRILLAAAKLLNDYGIAATVTSVEVRENPVFEGVEVGNRAPKLFEALGLSQFWRPRMGSDSIEWLEKQALLIAAGREAPIDFAYVDSNHTYNQVLAELEGLSGIMSDSGVILVDNAFTLVYVANVEWFPDETLEGAQRGGQYGAILAFLGAHPEWSAEWSSYPADWAYLRRAR